MTHGRKAQFLAGLTLMGFSIPAQAQNTGIVATLLADSNRDGAVNDADREGRAVWSRERGAILLPNIGDKAKRCPAAADKRFTDAQLEACNDAQGDAPRAPEYFAPVRTLGIAGLSPRAMGRVDATGPGADKARIFIQRNGKWTFFSPADRLTAAELKKGAVFGVDARDVIRDSAAWDGSVTLQFSVSDAGRQAQDRVAMRVAPVIVHNHLQKAERVIAPQSGDSAIHKQFVSDLSAALRSSGFAGPLTQVNTTDNWAQDFVEFGYVAMPGTDGRMISLRIAIRSPQPGRAAGRALFDLRGPGMGVVQTGGDDYHQADSFGNLETVPPYALNGATYPVGRVIYGDAGDGFAPHRDFIAFFQSQGAQAPIVLDTSWLAIAHVDEFVQFVPADNARGWTIAIKDVASALRILRDAQRQGHGGVKAFSRKEAPDISIDQLLANKQWLEDNELARRKVEMNLAMLQAATGVGDEEIIRVPGLFHESEFSSFVRKARERGSDAATPPAPPPLPEGVSFPPETITYGPGVMIAYYPAAVNGLLIDRRNYIAPRQWGPVVDGVDLMEAGVKQAYARLGVRTWFIDDWMSHHRIGGEVHCGTNAIRQIDGAWWTAAPTPQP